MLTLEDTSSRRLNSRLLVVVAIAFPMTFFVPSWNAINLIFYFFLLLLISIKNITTGFLLVTFFSFWIGLLRWDNKDNLLPSIVDSASLIILIAALLINYLLRPTKLKLRFHPTSFALLACLICIAAINLAVVADILLRSDDAIEIALKIREYVLPSFTFFIALTAFSNHKNAAAKYVSIITIAGGLVATLNIVHYIYGLPLFIPRFVPQHGLENVFVSRELFGLSFYRMHHILGLSTQGGGGAIYMGIALIALVLFFKGKQYRPLWLFCFISTLACAILIVSFSALLVLCLFIATLPIITGLHKPLIFFATLPVGATLISLLALGNLISAHQDLSLLQYILSFSDEKIFKDLSLFLQSGSLLLGDGLGLKSGGGLGMADLPNSDRHDQLFDQWIFVALYQLGLVPFLSLALSYALLFFVFIGLANKKSINREYTICFFTLYLVCVSFVHGAAPIERLFSPIFYTTLAFCFSALFARQEPKEAVSTK